METHENEVLFQLLRNYAELYGWELTRRDPGPDADIRDIRSPGVCECDNTRPEYCPVHGAEEDTVSDSWPYSDRYETREDGLYAVTDPKITWSEDQIRQSTAETRRIYETLTGASHVEVED